MSEKNSEYYEKIGEEVLKTWLKNEGDTYEDGRKDAIRCLMIETGKKYTYGELLKRFQRAIRFLENEKAAGKIAIKDTDTEIWEKSLNFSAAQLLDFAVLQYHDLQMRLKKSREVYIHQSSVLRTLSQLTIE